jgi:Protein of unknown function (DUF3592)
MMRFFRFWFLNPFFLGLIGLAGLWSHYPFVDYGLGTELSITSGVILSSTTRLRDTSSRYNFYEPVVTYKYQVDGVSYIGTGIRLGWNDSTRFEDQAKVSAQKYTVGSSERIYYAKKNPQFSLLIKDFPYDYIIKTLYIIFASIFVFVVMIILKEKK